MKCGALNHRESEERERRNRRALLELQCSGMTFSQCKNKLVYYHGYCDSYGILPMLFTLLKQNLSWS